MEQELRRAGGRAGLVAAPQVSLVYLSIYWYIVVLEQAKGGPVMTTEPSKQDKQITIEVPEDRVAEFYAFYGRFLAGFPRRRGHGRGHRCGPHRGEQQPPATTESETQTV
jgi:hypothetical protein